MTSKKVLTMKQGGQSGCVKRSTFRFTDKVDEAPAVQAAEFLLVYQFQFPMDLGGLLEHSRNRAIFGLGKLNGILGGLARNPTYHPVNQLNSRINAGRLRGF